MRLILALALALGACGDDDGPTSGPLPDLSAPLGQDTLVVHPDPLTLVILRGGDPILEMLGFVEIGVVDRVDETRYYDPAAPTDVTWQVRTRARALGEDGVSFELEGGGRLSLGAGAVLTLDASTVPGAVLTRFVLPLEQGEEIHGLGSLEDGPGSRGVVREMQLRIDPESESGLNEVHVPVPLALYPSRGLGFFADEPRPGAFDVGAARAEGLLVTFATRSLTLVPYSGTAFEVLDAYTARTGRPRPPPMWGFAPFQWRNVSDSGAQVIEDAQALRMYDIPGSCIWIDNPWQTGYNTFEFDPGPFPDPQGVSVALEALGFHLMVWSTPYVGPAAPTDADHAEGVDLGYFVRDYANRVVDFPWQNGPGAMVDFSAAGATAWWRERIARATAVGIRGFKLDFGEELVPDLGGTRLRLSLAGGESDRFHAHYAGLYHEAYLGALPEGDGFLLTRAGGYGTQTQTTCVWPGDLDNDLSRHDAVNVGGLPAAISVMLSLSASGFPFYGSDIGGFRNGAPTGEVLSRWAEYAALGTVMQLGGGGTAHLPWDTVTYGPEALPIYQRYSRLHMDLFPYLYSLAQRAAATGRPVTYAPGLVHPGHPYQDAFYVGEGLFVAPVVEEGATRRSVTLPPGEWIDFWTGEAMSGAVTVDAPLDTLPIWRKADQLVVLLRTPIDTFLPASDAGVLSWADPATRRQVRVLVAPREEATFDLWDGGHLEVDTTPGEVAVTAIAGSAHDDFRFELDWNGGAPTGASLPAASDLDALEACRCFYWDPAAARVYVHLPGGGTVGITR